MELLGICPQKYLEQQECRYRFYDDHCCTICETLTETIQCWSVGEMFNKLLNHLYAAGKNKVTGIMEVHWPENSFLSSLHGWQTQHVKQ